MGTDYKSALSETKSGPIEELYALRSLWARIINPRYLVENVFILISFEVRDHRGPARFTQFVGTDYKSALSGLETIYEPRALRPLWARIINSRYLVLENGCSNEILPSSG